jgi:DMSO/TMAO reductase YedYZ molybdopterin-dependent catalytic subunit
MTDTIHKPLPSGYFIRHETNAETRIEALANAGYLTPNHLFFVRNNSATPAIDARTWRLQIEGAGIERPFSLVYDELLALPSQTVTCFLECAGNGRTLYDRLMGRPASGTHWGLGAFGVAEWRGVALAALLERGGLRPSAVDVLARGLDTPPIERPIPVEVALRPDTLIATHMNGAPLPHDHGFPARLIVPGRIGMANIKWLGAIRVSTERVWVEKNTTDYVLVGPDYEAKPPALGEPLDELVVKSALYLPWPGTLPAGPQTLAGYAWSPFGTIAQVDVSLDGGTSFAPARLVGPNLPKAGTRWEFDADLRPGEITITPRATDDRGYSQYPVAEQKWNELGYLFGAMAPHPVTVTG